MNPTLWAELPPQGDQRKANPCIALYGKGPDGATCKGCKFLRGLTMSKTYWKCTLRKLSHSTATDHRVTWPACGRYEERNEADGE